MSLRTHLPHYVGPLRNKVSVNLADDEFLTLTEQAAKHIPPLSQAGQLRQAWLDWSLERGDVVEANEPTVKQFKKRR